MRKLILAAVATAVVMSVPMSVAVKAEDTTVIRKDLDGDASKTIIKKEEPREEKKVIIHKDSDD